MLPVVDPFVLLSEKLNMVIVLSSRQSWIDQKVAVVVFIETNAPFFKVWYTNDCTCRLPAERCQLGMAEQVRSRDAFPLSGKGLILEKRE